MNLISPEENGSLPLGAFPSELVALKERIQDQPNRGAARNWSH